MLLYNQAIGLSAELAPDSPRYFVTGDGSVGFFNAGLTRALDAVTPNELAAGLSRLIQAEESSAAAGASSEAYEAAGERCRSGLEQTAEGRAVPGHDGARASARPGQGAGAQPLRRGGDRRAGEATVMAEKSDDQLAAALEDARKKHPDDLGLAICEALRAMAAK